MTLRRALSPMLPNLDAQLVPYSRTRAGQSASRPVTSAPHPPATTIDPLTHRGAHLLGDVATPGHPHHQPERHVHPSHLPLASDFSVSSIQDHNVVLQQTSDEEEQRAAGTPAQSNHQQLPSQLAIAEMGPGPSTTGLGAGLSYTALQPQGIFATTAPLSLGSVQPLQEQLDSQHRSGRMQPPPLNQHQQPNGRHLSGGAVSAWPGRVSVDTAGSVRRTVITVAQLQSTVQPEASSTQRAYHDDHAGRLAVAGSQSASQHQADAAADASAHHAHADDSQTPSMQQGMSTVGPCSEADLLPQHRQTAPASHTQDRALQNSPALNLAHHRANSPPPEGKAPSKGPSPQRIAVRPSEDDADAVLRSQQAVSGPVLISALQEVQTAEDDKAVIAALQALQLQICRASPAALQACLPQVCETVCVCVCV